MSGHSKWSTIKHKKALLDNRRGKIFTKLGRAITIASRDGGPDPNSNFQLRLAIDKARQFNMPNKNIERAIERGVGKEKGAGLIEASYEGFFSGQVAIIVEVVTDNKNRTAAELKSFFEKNGGSLGQPGSVMFLFERKGLLLAAKQADLEEQMLRLIDLGVDSLDEAETGIEILVPASQLATMKTKLEEAGEKIVRAELSYRPKTYLKLESDLAEKARTFLENLSELDDVVNVFSNLKL